MSKAMLGAWMLLAAAATSQMRPLTVVQSSVERLMAVVRDTELARPANAEKRRSALRSAAEALFDVPEMARRALAVRAHGLWQWSARDRCHRSAAG